MVKGINNPVAQSLRVLLNKLGINGKRNFLALRHGFKSSPWASNETQGKINDFMIAQGIGGQQRDGSHFLDGSFIRALK